MSNIKNVKHNLYIGCYFCEFFQRDALSKDLCKCCNSLGGDLSTDSFPKRAFLRRDSVSFKHYYIDLGLHTRERKK